MAYTSEITMPKMRGVHLSAFSLAYAIGGGACAIALEVIQQVSCRRVTTDAGLLTDSQTAPLEYRRAFYSQFAILGLWLPILVWLPESPAWLCKKGRHEQAQKSLRRLIGSVDGYDWDREYAVLKQEIDASLILTQKSSKLGFVACFKGTNLRRTLVSTIPFSMQVSPTFAVHSTRC